MERAFIEFARVATLIVETIPTHHVCSGELDAEQRRNLMVMSVAFLLFSVSLPIVCFVRFLSMFSFISFYLCPANAMYLYRFLEGS
jgi:hypothetical protein